MRRLFSIKILAASSLLFGQVARAEIDFDPAPLPPETKPAPVTPAPTPIPTPVQEAPPQDNPTPAPAPTGPMSVMSKIVVTGSPSPAPTKKFSKFLQDKRTYFLSKLHLTEDQLDKIKLIYETVQDPRERHRQVMEILDEDQREIMRSLSEKWRVSHPSAEPQD